MFKDRQRPFAVKKSLNLALNYVWLFQGGGIYTIFKASLASLKFIVEALLTGHGFGGGGEIYVA